MLNELLEYDQYKSEKIDHTAYDFPNGINLMIIPNDYKYDIYVSSSNDNDITFGVISKDFPKHLHDCNMIEEVPDEVILEYLKLLLNY